MNSSLLLLVQSAYDHIVSAHILESDDSDAAFESECRAWDQAYKAGLQSAESDELPKLFAHSRRLTQGWTKAREDRSASV